jgi:hypothetical protein
MDQIDREAYYSLFEESMFESVVLSSQAHCLNFMFMGGE